MYEIMPRPVLQLEVPPPRRELLFFWGGASRHRGENIRRDLWKYQANTTGFYVPISTFGAGRNVPPNAQTASVSFDYWMPRSVFCGSPPGWDGGDSNRYLPALVHGCIPVFLLEVEALPFEETVDWSNSAVRVRREDIPTLDRILRAIPPSE